MNLNKYEYSIGQLWQFTAMFCLVAIISLIPDFSLAAESASADGISCALYRVQEQLMGPLGKAIATIAVVVLGIGVFLGKLSWGLAIATACGIALIFSAPTIVEWISGDSTTQDYGDC